MTTKPTITRYLIDLELPERKRIIRMIQLTFLISPTKINQSINNQTTHPHKTIADHSRKPQNFKENIREGLITLKKMKNHTNCFTTPSSSRFIAENLQVSHTLSLSLCGCLYHTHTGRIMRVLTPHFHIHTIGPSTSTIHSTPT